MEEEVTLRGRDLYLGVVAVDAAGNAGQVSNIVQCQGIQNPFAACIQTGKFVKKIRIQN